MHPWDEPEYTEVQELRKAHRFAEVLEQLQRIAVKHPAFTKWHGIQQGVTLWQLGRYDEARQLFSRVVAECGGIDQLPAPFKMTLQNLGVLHEFDVAP